MKKEVKIMRCTLVRESSVTYEAVNDSTAMATLFQGLGLEDAAEEFFYMVALDSQNQPIGILEVSHGTLGCSLVHPREVFKRACICNARSVAVCHNHPSGDPTPSQEDLEITSRLKQAGDILGIQMIDHIIIGMDGRYCSLATEGYI